MQRQAELFGVTGYASDLESRFAGIDGYVRRIQGAVGVVGILERNHGGVVELFSLRAGRCGLHPASEIGDDNRVCAKSGTISGTRQELVPTGFTLTLPLGGGWCWTNIADSRQAS